MKALIPVLSAFLENRTSRRNLLALVAIVLAATGAYGIRFATTDTGVGSILSIMDRGHSRREATRIYNNLEAVKKEDPQVCTTEKLLKAALTLTTGSVRDCQGLTRRNFIRAGALGAGDRCR